MKPINLILRLIPDLHTEFKIACAKEGKSMNEVACGLIREYILKKKAVA